MWRRRSPILDAGRNDKFCALFRAAVWVCLGLGLGLGLGKGKEVQRLDDPKTDVQIWSRTPARRKPN